MKKKWKQPPILLPQGIPKQQRWWPKSKSKASWSEHKEKEDFLLFEIMRYETYILTLRTKNAHDTWKKKSGYYCSIHSLYSCTQICFFYLMILSDSFQSQKRVLRPKYKSIKSGLPFLKWLFRDRYIYSITYQVTIQNIPQDFTKITNQPAQLRKGIATNQRYVAWSYKRQLNNFLKNSICTLWNQTCTLRNPYHSYCQILRLGK